MQVQLLKSDQRSLRFYGGRTQHQMLVYIDKQHRWSKYAYSVLDNFYLNDYLGSLIFPETALTWSRTLVELLKLGGFNKFFSNIPYLYLKLKHSNINANKRKEFFTAVINPETALHVLGLKWYHVTDTLDVSWGVNNELKDSFTQRSVLSFVSSVFDSIGLVAAYSVRAHFLQKDIWRLSGRQWDDPLPNELRRKLT